ncbi:MAG: TMEM143 family protein [Thainema sp.]
MDIDSRRESFIPYPRQDIIKLCLADNRLHESDAEVFQSFCTLLIAFYHFHFHRMLEEIKTNYRVFDPNTDVQPLWEPDLNEYQHMETKVVKAFQYILERANYRSLPQDIIQTSLDDCSLIKLTTKVDFEDFDQFLCYYRGDTEQTTTVKKFYFWKKEQTVEVIERLVLMMKFKGDGYFRAKDKQRRFNPFKRKFIPGKMYVYFYKNIPKLDLDLLFPNVQTSMTWRDRIFLVGTVLGAAIPVILKALPNILLLIAAILLAMNAQSALQTIDVEEEQARNLAPVLLASLTLMIVLGGFAFKQYSQYKSKKIKFQKDVTETLFFKNLANNASVFQMLTDIAEEEECKEIILVYYHLLTSPEPLTPKALDAQIEAWMLEKTGTAINFDIQGPLRNLAKIRGRTADSAMEQSVLTYDKQGRCCVLPLHEARVVLDYVWDNAFRYNGF